MKRKHEQIPRLSDRARENSDTYDNEGDPPQTSNQHKSISRPRCVNPRKSENSQ